ncbi:MAG: hypothetical protein ACLSAF_23185 [Intestinimonas sp.]
MEALRTIWVFNSFDIIYLITGGGPANPDAQTVLIHRRSCVSPAPWLGAEATKCSLRGDGTAKHFFPAGGVRPVLRLLNKWEKEVK